LFDIDFFKKFNDQYGHLTGDAVLVAVGEKIATTVRTEDILARYGGEEFAVIARQTPAAKARVLGERIRRAIEKCKIEAESEPLSVTASVGVATWGGSPPDMSSDALIASADRALYVAKEAGRN
jgi:diguanylate cyclase (GGDEF)-like protein